MTIKISVLKNTPRGLCEPSCNKRITWTENYTISIEK